MSAKKSSKKGKQKPPKIKVNLDALMPKPKPINRIGNREILEQARQYPFHGAWVMAGWQEGGLTPVVVARQQPDERIIMGTFLVDRFLLGVKDADWKTDLSANGLRNYLDMALQGASEPCDIGFAHELIYGAVEYARRYGFEPHRDYELASLLLDPPEMHPRKHKIEFGKDGKPFFIAGPNDNVRQILSKLERNPGKGNYETLLFLGSPDDFF